MLARSRMQFGLRFIFAAVLVAACVAWWFRPGIVKPEFSVEQFFGEFEGPVRIWRVHARVRIANAGPESFWVGTESCPYHLDGRKMPETDESGRKVYAGPGVRDGQLWSAHAPPLRLQPGESTSFVIPNLKPYDGTLSIAVDIADGRSKVQKRYWSPGFAIPHDIFYPPPRE